MVHVKAVCYCKSGTWWQHCIHNLPVVRSNLYRGNNWKCLHF
nr:MAG TPA: hypothetical protein [Caudoviricetes sp.]